MKACPIWQNKNDILINFFLRCEQIFSQKKLLNSIIQFKMTGADFLFLISINIASDVAKFHFWEEISNRYLYGEYVLGL